MSGVDVRDLGSGFAAEVVGLELDGEGELDAPTSLLLQKAFNERGVLLFRDLDIDRAAQVYLSELVMGEDVSLAKAAVDANQQDSFWISNREPESAAPFGRLMFHCDMMWSDEPFQVLSLYAVDVQPPIVPTAFVNAVQAWGTLPPALRARVEGHTAVHVTGPEGFDDRRKGGGDDGELINPVRANALSRRTEVGYSHPRTGETILYVSQGMTKEIEGVPDGESENLLEELFEHLYRPESVWEHHWRNGDLVIWDNLAVQHARSNVRIDGPARVLRKIGYPRPLRVAEAQVQVYQPIS